MFSCIKDTQLQIKQFFFATVVFGATKQTVLYLMEYF